MPFRDRRNVFLALLQVRFPRNFLGNLRRENRRLDFLAEKRLLRENRFRRVILRFAIILMQNLLQYN